MIEDRLKKIKEEHDELTKKLSDPELSSDFQKMGGLSKRQAELNKIIEKHEELTKTEKQISEAEELLKSNQDQELQELAEKDGAASRAKAEKLSRELELMLIPKGPHEDKNIIIEIRAGTGGEEASLFAAALFRMYSRYAEGKGFGSTILSSSRTGLGGFKEIIFEIRGESPFKSFQFESGVHRVQRIPETEKSGRIHTSTATVAVLPEAEEADIEIKTEDIRVDVFRSSGPGGQSVNTTDSAVRITHLPTGTVVSSQDEKSQIKNRAKAMKVLRSRILAQKEEEEAKKLGETRRLQIGTGERSEKIRTYNYPQDRITDHRIKLTVHGIEDVLNGNLSKVFGPLQKEHEKMLLEEDSPSPASEAGGGGKAKL